MLAKPLSGVAGEEEGLVLALVGAVFLVAVLDHPLVPAGNDEIACCRHGTSRIVVRRRPQRGRVADVPWRQLAATVFGYVRIGLPCCNPIFGLSVGISK